MPALWRSHGRATILCVAYIVALVAAGLHAFCEMSRSWIASEGQGSSADTPQSRAVELWSYLDSAVSVGLDAGALAFFSRPTIADDERSSPIPLQGQIALGAGVAF